MAEDNQNPTNPTPPPTGDEATPPPVAEENPVENKIVDEPTVEPVEPVEPTPEPVEAEPTPEVVKPEPDVVEPTPEPEPVTEEAVESAPEVVEAEPVTEAEAVESAPEVVEAEPVTEEAVEPAPEVVEEIIDPNQTIEAASTEEAIQPTAETKENVELIQGDIPKPGDKIESEEIPQTEAEEEAVGDPAEAQAPPPPTDETTPKTGFKEDGVTPLDAEEKLFSAIGYISFLALLPFLTRKDSEFAQHHGRQGLAIFIIIFIFTLLFSFSGTMRTLSAILTLAVAIGGGLMAYKGDWFKVPGIYDLSLKLKPKTPPTPPTVENPPATPEEENQQ